MLLRNVGIRLNSDTTQMTTIWAENLNMRKYVGEVTDKKVNKVNGGGEGLFSH